MSTEIKLVEFSRISPDEEKNLKPEERGITTAGEWYQEGEVEAQDWVVGGCPCGGHLNRAWRNPGYWTHYRCWACGCPFRV
jgi:hypothetical protein